ncbi:DNA translocase FtsK [Actinomadura namibiensis]|uniref:DNA translocase FtsK n=1 Tax=Actinomadura kijaniata TaxID=46161 RepID=UPI003610EBC7
MDPAGRRGGGAALSHALWGGPGSVAWAAIACTLGSTALTGLTWLVSHRRRLIGRVHSTATTAAASAWFTTATVTGVTAEPVAGALFFGGATVALSWNIRSVIRMTSDGEELSGGEALSMLFDKAKDKAGMGGARVRTTEVNDHKIKAKMQLPAGEMTHEDAQKATGRIESAMQLPPGAVLISKDSDRADRADMSVSDPRAIDHPVPWPGPSHPGASIDKPLRIGVYQDGDPVEFRFVGFHLQIQGMIGSGKSIGGAWNITGELITRRDAAVFSIDTSKDDQTMGPLRQGLHGLATTKARAVKLIRAMHAEIPQRTAHLAKMGLQNWEPGCGLLYWVLHIEEIAKLFEMLDGEDEERLAEIVKEIRSAGGGCLISLQRADYTQIPTLIRSQMAKMCFGVADPDDLKYGVSARQRKAEVVPHEWENHFPGKAYLDAKGIDNAHFAMPLRTYSWGPTGREANEAMRAHAAAFPAAAKKADEFTRRVMAALGDDDASTGPDTTTAAASASAAFSGPHSPHGEASMDEHTDTDAERAEFVETWNQLLGDAAELVITSQHASAAMLARKLRLPAEDAAHLIEALERKHLIGPPDQEGRRAVLVAADAGAAAVVDQLRREGDAVTAALRTEDPDPALTAGPEQQIQAPTEAEAAALQADDPGAPLDAGAARVLLADWFRRRHAAGNPTFTADDDELLALHRRVGRSRTWIYEVLKEFTAVGVLQTSRDKGRKCWTVVDLAPLDDHIPHDLQPAA